MSPSCSSRPRIAPRIALSLGLLSIGCGGIGQRPRLDDCARRVQALQAEGTQLRDENLGLRARSRELAQRAVDDSRRIQRLEAANLDLERSVVAYQDERESLSEAFDQLRMLVQAEGRGPTAALIPPAPVAPDDHPLHVFARAHPECRYDPSEGTWSIPTTLLFLPRSEQLQPGGELLLRAMGRLLATSGKMPALDAVVLEVAQSSVMLASASDLDAAPNDLARARAIRICDLLAEVIGVPEDSLTIEIEDKGQAGQPLHDRADPRSPGTFAQLRFASGSAPSN